MNEKCVKNASMGLTLTRGIEWWLVYALNIGKNFG